MNKTTWLSALMLALSLPYSAWGDEAAAKRWLDKELRPSTLTPAQQMEEMRWFIKAAKPYQGMTIRVISETIATHQYESQVLAKAFSEMTGINVVHDLRHEGVVVDTLMAQMRDGKNRYDIYVNDSDSIGTHFRYGLTVPLSDFMQKEGADVTLPTLDVEDFIGRLFGTGPDGKLYQLPDQQFANLYWFRHDWFSRPELKAKFKAKYGYELGVPVNWSAYEDIARFFTEDVKTLDGKPVYGHLDYAAKDASLGWRFSDAWLSLAGTGDRGLPNGSPVDEWGIRVDGCVPVGASVARGGELNGPSAVYAITQYRDWLDKYAPPEARQLTFDDIGKTLAKGQVAQMIFLYTVNTPELTRPGTPLVDAKGNPRWRYAPSPHGAYWREGMKLGYQDAGSWTLLKSTPIQRQKAAWLYAQFLVSKTVSLRKTIVGLTPIRESDLNSSALSQLAPKLGGLVEFYRSPARIAWTPTGTNVPDYPKLAPLWWQHLIPVVENRQTPQQALNQLAEAMDKQLGQLQQSAKMAQCAPKLGPRKNPSDWFNPRSAPLRQLANEKPRGETVRYEDLLQAWREGRVK